MIGGTVPLIAEARQWMEADGTALRSWQRLGAASRYAERTLRSLPEDLFGLSSGYFHLPIALSLEWGLRRDDWLRALTLTQSFGNAHFVIQDRMLDENAAADPNALLSDVLFVEYFDGLMELYQQTFPKGRARDVITLHRRHFDTYCDAVARDSGHRGKLAGFSADQIAGLGDKAAPVNVVLDLIADATGRMSRDPLTKANRLLCTGLQLLDDLADIEIDYRSLNFTFPLTTTLMRCIGVGKGVLAAGLPFDTIARAMYESGVAAITYDLADRFLLRAEQVSSYAGATCMANLSAAWRWGISGSRQEAERFRRGRHTGGV